MNKMFGILVAMVFMAVAVFDVGKESKEVLGLGPVIILLVFGLVMWLLLAKITAKPDNQKTGLTINLAIWLHSFFEGALAALSFGFGIRAGLIVCNALLIHILPECLAVVAALKQLGFSTIYSLRTYAITVVVLLASFGLFRLLPNFNHNLLTSLATIVAGGFIYLAVTAGRKVFQAN